MISEPSPCRQKMVVRLDSLMHSTCVCTHSKISPSESNALDHRPLLWLCINAWNTQALLHLVGHELVEFIGAEQRKALQQIRLQLLHLLVLKGRARDRKSTRLNSSH